MNWKQVFTYALGSLFAMAGAWLILTIVQKAGVTSVPNEQTETFRGHY